MEFSTRMTDRHAHRWLRIFGGTAKASFIVMALVWSITALAGEAEHYDAALSVVVLPADDKLSRLSDALVDAKIRSNPGLRTHEAQMRDLIADLYQSDELKSRAARVYMQHFNENELRQLAKLIRNPVAMKYSRIVPSLYRQMANIERELYEQQLEPFVIAQRSFGSATKP